MSATPMFLGIFVLLFLLGLLATGVIVAAVGLGSTAFGRAGRPLGLVALAGTVMLVGAVLIAGFVGVSATTTRHVVLSEAHHFDRWEPSGAPAASVGGPMESANVRPLLDEFPVRHAIPQTPRVALFSWFVVVLGVVVAFVGALIGLSRLTRGAAWIAVPILMSLGVFVFLGGAYLFMVRHGPAPVPATATLTVFPQPFETGSERLLIELDAPADAQKPDNVGTTGGRPVVATATPNWLKRVDAISQAAAADSLTASGAGLNGSTVATGRDELVVSGPRVESETVARVQALGMVAKALPAALLGRVSRSPSDLRGVRLESLLTSEDIRKAIVDEYVEVTRHDFGSFQADMYRTHFLVRTDNAELEAAIGEHLTQHVRRGREWRVLGSVGAVTLLLAGVGLVRRLTNRGRISAATKTTGDAQADWSTTHGRGRSHLPLALTIIAIVGLGTLAALG